MASKYPFDPKGANLTRPQYELQLIKMISDEDYAPLSSDYSPQLRRIVDLCLKKNPEERPSINELLQEPILVNCIKNSHYLTEDQLAAQFPNGL